MEIQIFLKNLTQTGFGDVQFLRMTRLKSFELFFTLALTERMFSVVPWKNHWSTISFCLSHVNSHSVICPGNKPVSLEHLLIDRICVDLVLYGSDIFSDILQLPDICYRHIIPYIKCMSRYSSLLTSVIESNLFKNHNYLNNSNFSKTLFRFCFVLYTESNNVNKCAM